MPFGEKTPSILAAEIEMNRQTHCGAFLILEGDSDMRFWLRWREGSCELVDAEGKSNVIGSLQHLDSDGVRGVLGIVDSDYDTFVGARLPSANLVATDAHDLECVLFRSGALDAVLHERGDPAKIERFTNEHGTDVRQALLERALVFGKVRLAATLCHSTDVMPIIRVPRFLQERQWAVDDDALFCAVAESSGLEPTQWREQVEALSSEDPWYVARGHDMVDILRIGLRRVLGGIPASVGRKDIARDLRLAATRSDLKLPRFRGRFVFRVQAASRCS